MKPGHFLTLDTRGWCGGLGGGWGTMSKRFKTHGPN